MIRYVMVATALALTACATTHEMKATLSTSTLAAAESAFSRSMQDRDLEKFASLIAPDAVFINGGEPLRGRPAILAHWKKFFQSPEPPFAWRPEIVEISEADGLGYTEGPVLAPTGTVIARFYSTWKLQPDDRWLVVFDNGYEVCGCGK